jgi:hypothetical protein
MPDPVATGLANIGIVLRSKVRGTSRSSPIQWPRRAKQIAAEAGVGAFEHALDPLAQRRQRLPIHLGSSEILGEDSGCLLEQHLDRGPYPWGRVKFD